MENNMKKILVLAAFAILTNFVFAAERVTVAEDTYGVFDAKNFPVLLRHDQAGIRELVQLHKCIAVPKGTVGLVTDANSPLRSIRFQPETNGYIQVYLLASSIEGAKVDNFQVSDLPRVPIHRPRQRPDFNEEGRLLSEAEKEGIPIYAVSVGDSVKLYAQKAIANMLHLPADRNWLIKPYVGYGPVRDGAHWFVEIVFSLPESADLGPANKTWIAVVREDEHGAVFTCELGADTPTLRPGEIPPAPAAQVQDSNTRVSIERLFHPLTVLDIPPEIPLGEVTVIEDTIGTVDKADHFDQVIKAQYFGDTETLDAFFEKEECVLIEKGTRVTLKSLNYEMPYLDVTFKGRKFPGQSGSDTWGDHHLYLPYSALLKEFSHRSTYVPKSARYIVTNESQERWVKGLPEPTSAPTETPKFTPIHEEEPAAVTEPAPQPANSKSILPPLEESAPAAVVTPTPASAELTDGEAPIGVMNLTSEAPSIRPMVARPLKQPCKRACGVSYKISGATTKAMIRTLGPRISPTGSNTVTQAAANGPISALSDMIALSL